MELDVFKVPRYRESKEAQEEKKAASSREPTLILRPWTQLWEKSLVIQFCCAVMEGVLNSARFWDEIWISGAFLGSM